MKITVDIDADVLAGIMKLTGESKKGPAITKAASEYVRKAKLTEFGQLLREGSFQDAFEKDYCPDRFSSLGSAE